MLTLNTVDKKMEFILLPAFEKNEEMKMHNVIFLKYFIIF